MDEDSSEYPSLACLEHPAANVPLQNRIADNEIANIEWMTPGRGLPGLYSGGTCAVETDETRKERK